MSNLAHTLCAQGDLAGARKLQERVLEVRRKALGEEHPDTLMSMNNLAMTLREQGDLERARKLHEQALDARIRILGGEHPNTTVSAWNLLLTLHAQGKTERVNTILEQNLNWVLKRAPETLSHQQRQIRGQLEEFLWQAAVDRIRPRSPF